MPKKQKPFFVGRRHELDALERLSKLNIANLVVVNGRRRIGKSRLIEEFGRHKKYYAFTGLAPRTGISAQDQRTAFARQLTKYFDIPLLQAEEWSTLFLFLADKTSHGEVVILFDEISWMSMGDPDFLGKLKNAWDLHFKKNTQLTLVLCGSISSWIEKNLLSNTGYLGRPSLHIHLDEISLNDCNQFWGAQRDSISSYEKFKYLAIFGGIPRYLELMDPKLPAEENIRFLCFTPHGPLFDEFDRIFSDIYGKRSITYQKIVSILAEKSATQETIAKEAKFSLSGDISEYLRDLELGGFIMRDYTWLTSSGRTSKLSHYRLKDNYTRFYLKYILPNKERIKKGSFINRSLTSLPAWDSIMGLQFENLVLQNHIIVKEKLGIKTEEIVFDNPFFQRKTKRRPGCQIDYMIQTKHNSLYICEIKFNRSKIKQHIIPEVKEKLSCLKIEKHFSKRPVLIHVNGVQEEVIDSSLFSEIIDFSELLE